MKRVLSFFIFVFSLTHTSAQLFTHVGGTVGFGQSKILGENSEFESVKAVQNFSIGLVGEHHFEFPIFISSEVNFYATGDSTIYSRTLIENNLTYSLVNRYKNMRYYIQIPLIAGLSIPTKQEDARIIIKTGLYYGALLGSRTTGRETKINSNAVFDSIIDAKGYLNYPKNDIGLVAAIGYGSNRYSLEFRLNKGLTSLFNQFGN